MRKFKYIGYVLQRNGGQKAHVKDRVRRAAAVMEGIWGIGKRRFGKDWGKKLWLFDRLIWSVMGYGVERERRDGRVSGEVSEVGFGGGW